MDEQEIRKFWGTVQLGDYLNVRYKAPRLQRMLRNLDRLLLAGFLPTVPRIEEAQGYVVNMNVYGVTLNRHDPSKDNPIRENRLAIKGAVDRHHICYSDILAYQKENSPSALEAKVS